jgi:hypothetical protein
MTEDRERECIRIAEHLRQVAELLRSKEILRHDLEDFSGLHDVPHLVTGAPGMALWIRLVGIVCALAWTLIYAVYWPLRLLSSVARYCRSFLSSPLRKTLHLRAPLPEDKNLAELWALYGSARAGYESDDYRLSCLELWLDQLYGPGSSGRIGLRDRLRERHEQHARGHAAAAERGGCILFGDAFESVLRQVSDELGSYAVGSHHCGDSSAESRVTISA